MPRTRRSIRLQEYDYSQPGEYFVTICTYQMQCLLGEIRNGRTQFNRFGRIVEEEWLKTPCLRPDVKLDEFVIMPNHVHGILVVRDFRGTPTPACDQGVRAHVCASLRCLPRLLGLIVKGFKSACKKRINQLRQTPRRPLWQRNYHEHIIRDDEDPNDVREYILANPLRWELKHPQEWH